MRVANQAIERQVHPIPTFEEMLPHIGRGKFFSKLDIEQAFYQLELHPNSRNITAFITKTGVYRFKRLNMGIACAPEMFQNRLEMILLNCTGSLNFADDIIVYGETKAEHDRNLELVMNALGKWNVVLNWSKCKVGVTELEFLGPHLTSKSKVGSN